MRARGAQLAARLLRCASTSQPCSHGLPQTGCLAQALALGSPTAAPDARLIASRTSGTCLGSSSPLVTGQWQACPRSVLATCRSRQAVCTQQLLPWCHTGLSVACAVQDHACSCAQQQRCGITADARPGSSEQLTNQEYHRLSDLTLADLMSKLEPILEDCGIEEAEIEYSEVAVPTSARPCWPRARASAGVWGAGRHDAEPGGAWHVCDQQAGAEQAALAVLPRQRACQVRCTAPAAGAGSGPDTLLLCRYDCKAGSWISGRDDSDLHETLEAELSQVLGSLELEPAPTVRQGWLGYGADPT